MIADWLWWFAVAGAGIAVGAVQVDVIRRHRKRSRLVEGTMRASQRMVESQQELDAAVESYGESVERLRTEIDRND